MSSIFDNLNSDFIVIKDGAYKVLDKKAKVTYECKSKRRAFELARQLNDNKTE